MFLMDFQEGKGWINPRIEPYHSLALDPAAMVLHYGQEVFEGLKAYRGKDGGIYLFRPRDNFIRLNRSAVRVCMPEVDIDFDLILRVMTNLLENAIKYTRTGGEIRVSAQKAKGVLDVSVRDSGSGIPPADRKRIFEKYARIHRKGKPKGRGLGLAFCRLAVEAHGGRIWVESAEGEGSTFHFTLPL